MEARPFQIILISIFFALGVGGLIVFATFRGFGGEANPYGARVEIWGTLAQEVFDKEIELIRNTDKNFGVVTYREFDPRTYQSELINAIAEGRGPDLVVISNDLLLSERGKLLPISYEAIPRRSFVDTYVEGAEVFLSAAGVYGIPFAVDPLLMYWNRDLFSSAGLANPPTTWEDLIARTLPAVIVRTPTLEIIKSAVAFGEYANVRHAKYILALLMLQTGSSLVTEDPQQGYMVSLSGSGDTALRFYTDFANPARATYSWSRSLPEDFSEFLAGDLALYFGFGSEIERIREANPNLNFDAAEVPQGEGVTIRRGYGTFYALAIPKSTPNPSGAYQAALRLSSPEVAVSLADKFGFAPVLRSAIAAGTNDSFKTILFRSALVARAWLDPNPALSDNIFKEMVEDVTSGRQQISPAIGDAQARLRQLIQ